jgi:hypothetical protein
MARFRWIRWNLEHVGKHGIRPEEAEWVVRHPAPGYPRKVRGAYVVWGKTASGRWLQVAFERDDAGVGGSLFVFHARPLTEREKGRIRR